MASSNFDRMHLGEKGHGRGMAALWSFMNLKKDTETFDLQMNEIPLELIQTPFLLILTMGNMHSLRPLPQGLEGGCQS